MAALLQLLAVLLVIAGSAQRLDARFSIEAQAYTNGPFGQSWILRIEPNGNAEVTTFDLRTGKNGERRFTVARAQLDEIRKAVEENRFTELPATVGSGPYIVDGPERRIYVTSSGHVHRVTLPDPATAKSGDATRFNQIWRLLVTVAPVSPPL